MSGRFELQELAAIICMFNIIANTVEFVLFVSMFCQEMREEMLGMMSAQKAWLYSTEKQQIMAGLPASQSELPERSMRDSMIEGVIPLSTSKKERLQ